MGLMSRVFSRNRSMLPAIAKGVVRTREDYLDALRMAELLISGSPLDTNPIKTKSSQLASYAGWVYACVRILSNDVGARPSSVWEKKGKSRREWSEVETHPVMVRPNAGSSWKQFTELSALHLGLTGECFWNLITKSPGGPVLGVQAIPPSWITGYELDANGRMTHWIVNVPGKRETPISADDIIFIREPHPTNLYKGASPVEAFALSYNMDLYSRAYTGNLLKNRARPDGIITTEQSLTPEQADTIRERWLQRWGKSSVEEGPSVLGKGSSYQAISLSIADLAFIELAQLSRDQILGIYRVPSSKLGILDTANLANSREAENTYAENGLMPLLSKIEDATNDRLMPRLYDNADKFHYEYESPIRRDVAAETLRSRADFKLGAIKLNEHRENIGEDPDPNGNVYYLPMGIRIVEEIEEYDPMSSFGSSSDTDSEDYTDDDDDGDSDDNDTKKLRKAFGDQRYELSGMYFLAAQSVLEKALKGESRKNFSKEAKLIIAGLKEAAKSKTRATLKMVGDEIVEEALAATRPAWRKSLTDSVFNGLEKGFGLLAGDGIPEQFLLSWEMFRPQAVLYAKQNAGKKVKGIQNVTRKKIAPMIANGIESGTPIAELSKEISDAFDIYKGSRAQTIARTETSGAVNAGKWEHTLESERKFEISYLKTWNSVGGERTRDWHQPDAISPSVTIPLHQTFTVDGQQMMRPMDDTGSARNVINCRCTTTLEVL